MKENLSSNIPTIKANSIAENLCNVAKKLIDQLDNTQYFIKSGHICDVADSLKDNKDHMKTKYKIIIGNDHFDDKVEVILTDNNGSIYGTIKRDYKDSDKIQKNYYAPDFILKDNFAKKIDEMFYHY